MFFFTQTANVKLCNKVCRFSQISTVRCHFAREVLCGSPRATMSPWLSNHEDIRTRFYHSTHSHSSVRSIAAHFCAECAMWGHPELLWERENLKWAIRRHDSRIAAAQTIPCLLGF